MYRDQIRRGRDPNVVRRAAKATFNAPLHWKEPRLVFTCSLSDFFVQEADDWRSEAWDIIRSTPHTYQVLTKRIERAEQCLPSDWGDGYPNVWLGVSAEDQTRATERIPLLLRVPARVHFISAEPLLGPLDLSAHGGIHSPGAKGLLDWVIAGGESGPGYRVCDKRWAMSLRDQCKASGTPFFWKQWGGTVRVDGSWGGHTLDGVTYDEFPEAT